MHAVTPKDDLDRRLGAEPLIASLDDVDCALAEIAWLDSREETVAAALKQRIDLLKDEAKAELQVQVGRSKVAFADRRKALADAVLSFAEANADQFFADGKTRKFNHGTVATKVLPAKLDFDTDAFFAAVETLAQIDGPLLDKLVALLQRTKLNLASGRKADAALLLDVSLTPSKTRILSAWKQGTLKDDDLAELEARVTAGNSLAIKATLPAVSSQSREAIA